MNSLTSPPIEIPVRAYNCATFVPASATTGTATSGSSTRLDWASVFVPGNMPVVGVKLLLGTGGNGNLKVSLHDSAGTLLAVSAAVATGTTATNQSVPFTTPYQVVGPGTYLIGVVLASGSDSIRTIPAQCAIGILTGAATITANTPATFTPTAGAETATSAPIAALY